MTATLSLRAYFEIKNNVPGYKNYNWIEDEVHVAFCLLNYLLLLDERSE